MPVRVARTRYAHERKHMRVVTVILMMVFFLAGCGVSGEKVEKMTPEQEEAREKSVFWQMQEPRIQLDPVEEEEVPAVMSPTMEGEN